MVSAETGIAPNDLLDAGPGILQAIVDYLGEQAEESQEQQRRAKLREALNRRLT